jgi:phosphonate degradation associated HDIG domain protein
MTAVVGEIERLFADRGAAEYFGEPVTQLGHALQTAALAEAAGAPADLIAAALLHDVGHLLPGPAGRHEDLGYEFLRRHFGPAVCEPVRLHVPAKRYLCAAEPRYVDGLSPASVASLAAQGGPMTADEVTAFESTPHFAAAVALRRWDDAAKVPGRATPPLGHFLTYVERVLPVPSPSPGEG